MPHRVNRFIASEIRIEWAGEKLDQLESLIQRGIDDALKTPVSESSVERTKVLTDLLYKVAPEARRLVSEYALHARAALDYIIYDLALWNTRIEQKRTQFPINTCQQDFPQTSGVTGRGPLKHLTAKQIALVERFQPYHGFMLLQVLHELSNRDKHRHFAHIQASALTAPIQTPNTDPIPHHAKMEVKFHRAFEITLGDGFDATKTLRQLHALLTNILDEFNALFGL
jgi:hypothetical protein